MPVQSTWQVTSSHNAEAHHHRDVPKLAAKVLKSETGHSRLAIVLEFSLGSILCGTCLRYACCPTSRYNIPASCSTFALWHCTLLKRRGWTAVWIIYITKAAKFSRQRHAAFDGSSPTIHEATRGAATVSIKALCSRT